MLDSVQEAVASEPDEGRTPGSKFGRYLVIRTLGLEATGAVFHAYDPRLRREVMLRVVRSDVLISASRESVMSEAQMMARLSHPNIVAVYDAGFVDDAVFVATELVHGSTVGAWLHHEPRSWREIVDVFVSAGRGLSAAHAAGLLHRNLKPSSILVGTDGRVRVTEFGLSSSAPADASTSRDPNEHAAATACFAVREGASVNSGDDQYAFCLILWEALTGKPYARAAANGARAPLGRDAAAPQRVLRAIARGVAADASERWPTMDALLDVLVRQTRDRRVRWQTASGLSMAALAASGVVFAQQKTLSLRCSGARDQLANVWDAEQQDAARSAFMATGMPYAAKAWEQTVSRLDRYATQWVQMHQDACEATAIRGEQPAHVLDVRMACLHRAKSQVAAVAKVLASADTKVVEHAHDLVEGLVELSDCADVEALLADVSPPKEADRARVETARDRLTAVKALRMGGKHREALAEAELLAHEATQVGYGPLLSETMLELSAVKVAVGAVEDASEVLKKALRSALRSKQWGVARDAAINLVMVVGSHREQLVEALSYGQTAQGLIEGASLERQAILRHNLNLVRTLAGISSVAEAVTEARAILQLHQDQHADSLSVAEAHLNLGDQLDAAGHYEEAEAEFRASLAIHERLLGPDHPKTGDVRLNLAALLLAQGREEPAEAELRRALAVHEQTLGSDHPAVATAYNSLGVVLRRQGRYREAAAYFGDAVPILEASHGSHHTFVARTRCNLAQALSFLGRLTEAETQLRAVIDARAKLALADDPEIALARQALGRVYTKLDRHEEAVAELRSSVASYERRLGREHASTALARGMLGAAHLSGGWYPEAENHLRDAVAGLQRAVGDDHANVAEMRGYLAEVLLKQHRAAEALPIIESVWQRVADDVELPAESRAWTAYLLSRTLKELDSQHERARSLARKSLELYRSARDLAAGEVPAEIGAWLSQMK